ncbi:lymphocyte antigen 86 [Pyxicephalus adspersus]|uniref:lymphocyte antigen 86 n=1 Tax=Pyxicephalus adspersus TaxID=30357 RepID=UPI003B5B5828
MKHFSICLLVFCYLCLGETREWPRHTICKLKDFEAYYQSCDPLQDIGFSLNPCKNLYEHDVNISLGVTLRHDINSLHYSLIAFYNEHALLTQEFFLCQNDYQAYSFCGKKKGDFIFFQHPLRTDAALKLKGHFRISINMFNEDNFMIVCVNFLINLL